MVVMNDTTTTLKFPEGNFTHTELALHNGRTNQQVWTRYQQAIKDGVIISAGTRSTNGRGKPSLLWTVNPNPGTPGPVIVKTPKIPKAPKAPKESKPAAVMVQPVNIVPDEAFKATTIQTTTVPVLLFTLPTIQPAKAPVVEMVKNIIKPTRSATEPTPEPEPEPMNLQENSPVVLTSLCPVCKQPLSALKDATGYYVWCTQKMDVCESTENPAGHGRTVKDALAVLNAKWEFAMKGGNLPTLAKE